MAYETEMPSERPTSRRRRLLLRVAVIVVALSLLGFAAFQVFNFSSGTPANGVPAARPGAADGSGTPASNDSSAGPSGAAGLSKGPVTASASPKSSAANPPGPPGPCGAFPNVPNSSCTGWKHTGVSLHSCPTTLSTANAVYDSCQFNGTVEINASNIQIKRSLVLGRVDPHSDGDLRGVTLTDVEIDGRGNADSNQSAIGNNNYTCSRCDIHGTGRGANLGYSVIIRDSYIHDFVYSDGAHQTAIGSNGGSHYQIIHNNLQCNSNAYGCSSALSFYGDDTQINDALVQNNLFNTDGSYCTYAGSVSAKPYPKAINVRYLNNLFGRKFKHDCAEFGPVAAYQAGGGNVWTGNVWQDGTGTIDPQS